MRPLIVTYAWLLTRLKAAPKPLAVFAANGTLAVEVRDHMAVVPGHASRAGNRLTSLGHPGHQSDGRGKRHTA